MEDITNINEEPTKKKSMLKILIWVVIIILIIVAIFITYNILSKDEVSAENKQTSKTENVADDLQQQNSQEVDEEKPPIPPE